MDWQPLIIIIAVVLAVAFLVWSWRESKKQDCGCGQCLAQHNLKLKKRPAGQAPTKR